MFLSPTTTVVSSSPARTSAGAVRLAIGFLSLPLPAGAFSQSGINYVYPPRLQGPQYLIRWSTSNPSGTWWQIYINGNLAWSGQSLSALLPFPSGPTRVDLGWVTPGFEYVSFASSLPARPARQAQLSWVGGAFLGGNLASFNVYASPMAGGAVDYAAPASSVTVYPAGIYTDGFGMGGYGDGGFGSSSSDYSWSSPALSSGSYSFAITPVSASGNVGAAMTTSVAIEVPPREPPSFPDRSRLHYTYSGSSHEATLNWRATTN